MPSITGVKPAENKVLIAAAPRPARAESVSVARSSASQPSHSERGWARGPVC